MLEGDGDIGADGVDSILAVVNVRVQERGGQAELLRKLRQDRGECVFNVDIRVESVRAQTSNVAGAVLQRRVGGIPPAEVYSVSVLVRDAEVDEFTRLLALHERRQYPARVARMEIGRVEHL